MAAEVESHDETRPLYSNINRAGTDHAVQEIQQVPDHDASIENDDEDKSQTIDSKASTPETAKHCNAECCPILHPMGTFKIIWDILVTIVIVISAIEIPMTMTFDVAVDFTTRIGVISFCIDIFLCCDIMVTFRTAYFDEWDPLRLIWNPKVIALRYLKGWFTFDFITSFPFNVVFDFGRTEDDVTSGVKLLRIIRLFRLFRVFRIYKMLGIMREINRMFPTLKKWIGITQVMVAMLFVAHYLGCLWFAVGKQSQNHGGDSWLDYIDPPIDIDDTSYDVSDAYSTAMYWSVVTLFTTGYGDITAHNKAERWVAIFVIVVGSIMTAYLVGTLTVLAFEGDKKDQWKQERLDEAYTFGTHFGLSNELIRAITAHIEYHCAYNYVGADPNEFMNSLPHHLRSKVETEIAGRAIRHIDIFQGLSDKIMGNITVRLKAIGCNAGYELFKEGDLSSEIYLLRVGAARLFFGAQSPLKHEGSRLLQRGDICGEYCIISSTRQNTLRCETWCEFLYLRRDELKGILWDHLREEEAAKCWENMKQILATNYRVRRRLETPDSTKVLRAKAKVQLADTIYEDLLSTTRTKNKAGMVKATTDGTEGESVQIAEANAGGSKSVPASGLVDRMRNISRIDSGLKDFKMKQHMKELDEKGIELRAYPLPNTPNTDGYHEGDKLNANASVYDRRKTADVSQSADAHKRNSLLTAPGNTGVIMEVDENKEQQD